MINEPVFFLAKDVERAIGLEDTYPNYYIITSSTNHTTTRLLKERGYNIYTTPHTVKYSFDLLLMHDVQQYIGHHANQYKPAIMFFKNSPASEFHTKQLNWQLLASPSRVSKIFERKIQQSKIFEENNIPHPQTIIMKLEDYNFDDLKRELDIPFVIQFDIGHTGNSTYIIKREDDIKQLALKRANQTIRILKFINGNTWTINAVTTKKGVFLGGLSLQITGIPECTSSPASTVGNDWTATQNLSGEKLREIESISVKIGNLMYQKGFKGLFGIDFIIEEDTNSIYVIEINARQPASISLYTHIQEEKKEIPLKLFHIAEFLTENINDFENFVNQYQNHNAFSFSINPQEYNQQAITNTFASQLFYRNKKRHFTIKNPKPQGIYMNNQFLRQAYSIKEIKNKTEKLILSQPTRTHLHWNDEIFRVIRKDTYQLESVDK